MKKIIALIIVTIISLTSIYAQSLVINDRNTTIKMDCTGVNGDGNFIIDIQVLSESDNESDITKLRMLIDYKYLIFTSGVTNYVAPDLLKKYIRSTKTKVNYIKRPVDNLESEYRDYPLHNSKEASKQLKEYFQQLLDSYSLLIQELNPVSLYDINVFTAEKDEFSNITWVKPIGAPAFRNTNGVYCYFATENGRATDFRFVYQYSANDWLFIRNMIFNIDGENITIVPNMDTDYGYGGRIWEWCDVAVNYIPNNMRGINEDFIKKIANATSVKVKMNGSKYYAVRALSASQIKSIKDTYEYYLALGGHFTN